MSGNLAEIAQRTYDACAPLVDESARGEYSCLLMSGDFDDVIVYLPSEVSSAGIELPSSVTTDLAEMLNDPYALDVYGLTINSILREQKELRATAA